MTASGKTPEPPAVSEALREAVARDVAIWTDMVPGRRPCRLDEWLSRPAGPIASEINRLTGERDRLQRAVEAYQSPPRLYTLCDMQGSLDRAEAAEAETARLRAALEEIAKGAPETEPHPWDGELDTVCWNTAQIARAALTSQEKTDV